MFISTRCYAELIQLCADLRSKSPLKVKCQLFHPPDGFSLNLDQMLTHTWQFVELMSQLCWFKLKDTHGVQRSNVKQLP
jgi:hypothetical protein